MKGEGMRYLIVCEDGRHELRAALVGHAEAQGTLELQGTPARPIEEILGGYLCGACARVRETVRRLDELPVTEQAKLLAALPASERTEVTATRAEGVTRRVPPIRGV